MRLLGTMQPTSKFGEVFQYSNLMAAAAGFIGGSLAYPGKELGAAYDEAMRTKVFVPLGMTHTTFDFARALKGDLAQPHGEDVDGKPARARMDPNELDRAVPARGRRLHERARPLEVRRRWSSRRECSRTASGSSPRRTSSRGARRRSS